MNAKAQQKKSEGNVKLQELLDEFTAQYNDRPIAFHYGRLMALHQAVHMAYHACKHGSSPAVNHLYQMHSQKPQEFHLVARKTAIHLDGLEALNGGRGQAGFWKVALHDVQEKVYDLPRSWAPADRNAATLGFFLQTSLNSKIIGFFRKAAPPSGEGSKSESSTNEVDET